MKNLINMNIQTSTSAAFLPKRKSIVGQRLVALSILLTDSRYLQTEFSPLSKQENKLFNILLSLQPLGLYNLLTHIFFLSPGWQLWYYCLQFILPVGSTLPHIFGCYLLHAKMLLVDDGGWSYEVFWKGNHHQVCNKAYDKIRFLIWTTCLTYLLPLILDS